MSNPLSTAEIATALHAVQDLHRPVVGSTVWAVVHPMGDAPAPGEPDDRWVTIMGEVNGVRLDTPAWGYAQVWSTEALCREHAWSMQCVGRRFYGDLDVRRIRVVGPSIFRLATA